LILWITRLRKFSTAGIGRWKETIPTAGNVRWNEELTDRMDHKVEEVSISWKCEME